MPPQIRAPRSRLTTERSRFGGNVTSASTSIVSAVPAGEVIARLEVFGISIPWAAMIGTTNIEVRLPGIPPMQCLSATRSPSQCKR